MFLLLLLQLLLLLLMLLLLLLLLLLTPYVFPHSSLPRLADSKKITMQSDPTGGKGVSSGIVPLAHEGLLAHRPVNSLAFVPAGGEPLVLAAYGPVGAQLGAAELLKVWALCGKGCGKSFNNKGDGQRCCWLLRAQWGHNCVLQSC